MFETLLEKLLGRIIGEYVEGISKDQMKVGIFNGNVEIKNLRIKKSVIDQLNIPFELKFGMIEHIKMKIPWTSLQSSPVEAYLKGLYVLIVPKDKSSWHLIQQDLMKNKHNFLHQYAQNLKDTITERIKMQQESQGKEQGYFGKLVQKIIDNLQVEIEDIHIRVESPKQPIENCSLGISLDQFKMFTCDKNWDPCFVDSTLQTTVYKKLDISNFYIYFNSEEKHFLTLKCQTNEDYFEMMKELIYNEETKNTQKIKNQEYLLNFSTIGKLVQKKLTQELVDDKIPQFNIEISLNECNLNIQQQQIQKLQGIANLGTDYQIFSTKNMRKFDFYYYRPTMLPSECATKAEEKKVHKQWWKYVTKYSASQINRKKDNWIFLSEAIKSDSKKNFLRIYQKVIDEKNKLGYDILEGSEKRNYENILMTVSEKEIKSWLEGQIKESKIQEQLQKQKQKKQGYFGGWFNNQTDLKDDEKQEIENFVKDVFEQEDIQAIELPENYPKIKFKFIQKKFCINLLKKDKFEQSIEKIIIQAQNIEANYYMKQSGQKVNVTLQNFTVDYQKQNSDDQIISQSKIIYCNVQSENFDKLLKLEMEEKPEEIQGLDTKLNLELGSINLIYHKKMISTLIDIFTMDQINQGITDHIKNQTQKKIRQAQDIGENVVKNFMSDQPKILITLSMKTPQIILPVNQNQIQNSPCWVFHPGNLKVKGDTFTNNDNERNLYDNYSVSLKNMKMLYCNNTEILLSEKTDETQLLQDENLKSKYYAIFKDFNIEIDCQLLKKVFVDLNVIDARTKVNAHLNALELNFTPSVLKDLKEIANIFLDESTNYKLTEKKKILSKAQKGSFINVKSENKYLVYYAALFQNKVYLFENPKKDLQAQKEIILEGKEFVYKSINLEITVLENKKEILQFHFEDYNEYDSWKNHFIKIIDQIQERKLIFGEEEEVNRKTNLSAISTDDENLNQQVQQEDQEDKIVEIDLNFHFEDLIVNINADNLFKLCSSNLYLNMIKKKYTIDVELELHNFTLQTQDGNKLEYLITSNYEQSLACDILKSNYVQKQEKLIIINFQQKQKKNDSSQLAKISFGSVFFDIQPKRLAKLISLLLAENKTTTSIQQGDSLQDLVNDNELTPQILEIYENSDEKLNDPKNEKIEMSIELEIQAINVLLINSIIDAPLANLIIKDSQINVQMKKGAMDVQTDFNDLIVYDLTNYPHTLYKRNIEAIVPRQIFGKQESGEKLTLIHVEFSSKEPQIYNIGDDFVNSEVDVKIQGIVVSFHMQVIMRILSFLTDQLLPSLQPQNDQQQSESTNYEGDYLFKRQAYIALNKPYWMKMKVAIENVQCNLEINKEQFVRAYLSNLQLTNNRTLSQDRLIKNGLNLKPKIEGIWNDNYCISMQDLNCVLVENQNEKKLTQGLHMNLDVQMMAYDLEYKFLTHAIKISNYNKIHMDTDVEDITEQEMKSNGFYVDAAMIVKIEMLPFVAILGNHEYQALMGVLDQCVSKNDGYDHLFIKDFQQKEELKDPMNLVVNMKIHNISLVTLDNKKNDMVKSKVFLENFSLQMLTHPSQHTVIEMSIEDLKGYHLIQKDNKFFEKGFIGDFIITDQFETSDMQELKRLFIKKLVDTKYESKIQDKENKIEPKFTFSMKDCETRNIKLCVQNLKILAQTDVLLHLSQLTSMPPKEENKQMDIQRKQSQVKKIDVNQNKQEEKPMVVDIEVKDNFFVLTDAYFNKCIVTKGDIYLGVQMHPQQKRDKFEVVNFQTVNQEIQKQKKLSQSLPPGQALEEKQIFTMQIQMILDELEIFIADFAKIYDGNIHNVEKRQIILPWKLDFNVDQMQVEKVNKTNPLPDLVNIFLIKGIIQSIELKIANRDLDTISSIMNYSLALMGENENETKEKDQKDDQEVEELEVQQTNDLYNEYTFFYVSFNIVDHILLNLVYEHKTLFTPTLIFKIKKLKIVCDYEQTIKALVGFQIQMNYFNSEIFRWEPFIEKSTLKIEYQTEKFEKNIEGKSLRIQSSETENFNINISIPFIKKMKFLADTLEKINEEKLKELENLTENKILENLLNLKAENLNKDIEEKQETVFVSPIRVTNNTGYDLEVIYYKKFITLEDNNIPQMKNVKNDKIIIKNKQQLPLNIEENLSEFKEQQESSTQTFNYKFLSFNVKHPDLQIKKISGLNLEQSFARKLHLSGKQKSLKHQSLIYNSQNVDDLKEIEISSSMKIQNNIDKIITLTIDHPFKKYEVEIKPDTIEYIPFDYLQFLCYIHIDGKKMDWKIRKLESLQLKDNGYSILVRNNDYNFIFKIFRQKNNFFLTNLVAIPGIVFKNLLPVPIKVKFSNNKKEEEFTLDKQEDVRISELDISTIVTYQVKIQGFQYSGRQKLIENQNLVYQKNIILTDRNERNCNFNVVRLKKGFCHYNFAIFCDLILINETNFHYQYIGTTEKKKKSDIRIAGTKPLKNEEDEFIDKLIFIGSDKRTLKLKVQDHPNFQQNDYSNDIITQGLSSGVFQALMNHKQDDRQFFLEIGYKQSLQYLDWSNFITSKIIHLTPKTLLYNKTKYQIMLKNQSFVRDSILEPEEKQPLYVYDYINKKLKFLDIEVQTEEDNYCNLQQIDLNKAGSKLFLLKSQTTSKIMIIRLEILIENDYVVVNFLDRTKKNDIYLQNLSHWNLRVSQVGYQAQWDVIIPDQCQKELAFINPYKNSQFKVEVLNSFNDPIDQFILDMNKTQQAVVEIKKKRLIMQSTRHMPNTKQQKIDQISQRQIPQQNQSQDKIYLEANFKIENDSRKIQIKLGDQQSKKKNKELKRNMTRKKKEIEKTQQKKAKECDYENYQIEINKFGISFIAKYNDIVVEPFFIYFDKITAIAIMTKEQSEFQFAINYINIDNNYCALSKYPVFLTSQQSIKKSNKSQCINFHCVKNNNQSENLLDFDLIELDIKPLVLTTEYMLISVGNEISQQIDQILKSNQQPTYLDKYFNNQQIDYQSQIVQYKEVQQEWQIQQFKTSNTWIHCKHFRLAQIKLILTFGMNQVSTDKGNTFSDNSNVNMFIKTIGVTFVNVDETPVTLPNLELLSIFESLDGFQNIMMTHMKDQLYRNAAQIVGNLDIIGNPVSLFSNVAGGVQQFFGEPVEGFVKGPIEGVYGIAKGSTSLVKVTAASAFNTVSKVTNSLASGLTSLSMDQEYLRQRNLDRAHKPLTVFDGMGRGFMSLGKGVFSGVTGVFTKPITEIKKSGASGFFKGIAKGIGGLITKPIGGIFDAVSITADGIKNTVTFFDDKANGKKQRIPRVFYGSQRFFKNYQELDAQIMKALLTVEKKKFENDTFLEAIKIETSDRKPYYIILTYEHFIILDYKLKNTKMFCEIKYINKLDCLNKNKVTVNYICNNKQNQFTISNKETKILKIVKCVNYSRYIHYTNTTNL